MKNLLLWIFLAALFGPTAFAWEHWGYAVSQQKRKRIEEPFGWGKTIGGPRPADAASRSKTWLQVRLMTASYNLIRLPKLLEAVA